MDKDLILKKGDIVHYRYNGYIYQKGKSEKMAIDTYENRTVGSFERGCSKVIKVERPVKYETIYEYKEILDEKEKEWLGNFIKSTKIKNCKIKKWLGCSCKNEYLQINYDVFNYDSKRFEKSSLFLPIFKKGTMYKGMEIDKEYTLEELGL